MPNPDQPDWRRWSELKAGTGRTEQARPARHAAMSRTPCLPLVRVDRTFLHHRDDRQVLVRYDLVVGAALIQVQQELGLAVLADVIQATAEPVGHQIATLAV